MAIYQRMTIRGRGGALPTYQSQQAPYVPGQGTNARVSGADAEILARGYNMEAKALDGLARAGKAAVDVGLQAMNDYAKTKATELVTQYKMGMRQSMYGKDGILTREGESAFTANADTMSRSKELRGELLKDMQGSMVADIFNSVIDPEEAEYSLKAQEYEGKQYRLYEDRTDNAAFSEAAETAMTGYADPKAFAKNTGEALYFMERKLRRNGYSGEALDRGLKESSSKIFAGGIEQALAADDLASARRLLAEGSREWRPPVPHDLSKVGGVVEKGNIDIDNRKVEHRPDGSIATVESFSFNFDGVEVLIPTVIDGKKVSNDEAIAHFMKTGEHLGKFKTPEAATEYAIKLHENHAIQYGEARTRMTADDVAKAKKAIKVKAEALEKKWEAEKKEAEAEAFEKAVVSMTAEIGKQVTEYGGDVDQQTAKAFELTADIKDEKQKAEVRKRLAADIKERDTKHKAKVTLEVAEGAKWIAQTGEDDTSLTTSDQLAAIDLLNVSDDAKAVLRQRVSDRIEGKENKAASAANLRVFRAMWDAENGMSPERARAMMLDLNLNAEDTAKAMEYEGRASEYSQSRIEPLVRSVIDKNMPSEEVTKYYNALLTLIPAGDKWDDKAIKKALYDLKGVGTVSAGYDDGEEVRKSSTYRDSILSGEQDSFLPDIPAETVPLLNREVSASQPWFTAANAETKELMRKVWYYQKYLGKNVVLDESEQKLVEETKETYYARMGAR